MKFTAFQDKLQKGLALALKIISRNVSLPILENFLLKTEGGRLKILATNLEEAIEVKVAGKIENQGQTTVPAAIFANIISNLNDQKITLEHKNNILNIKTESYTAELKTQNPDDFPVIPEIKEGHQRRLKTKEVKKGLEQLLNIITTSPTRPEIAGVYFRFINGELKLVATDSFRLGEKSIKLPDHQKSSQQESAHSFILPFRAAAEISRLLEVAGEEFSLSFDKNQAMFSLDGVRLISRLIEGNYPDYEQIIPEKFTTELIVDKQEFLKKIRLVSVLSAESNAIVFDLNADKNLVNLRSASSAKGVSEGSLQNHSLKGDSLKISFNWRYITDGLSNLEGEKVIFRLNGSDKPSLLRTKENQDYFYLVMPIRE